MLRKSFSGMITFIVGMMFIGVLISSCEALNLFGISLSQSGTHIFPSANVGYGQPTPLSITVRNHSSGGTWYYVTIEGANASSFAHNRSGLIHINGTYLAGTNESGSSRDTFSVWPKTGLSAGTYTATVVVTESQYSSQRETFNISFTVN